MRKRSEHFELVVLAFAIALFFLGKIVFDNLLYVWLIRSIERNFSLMEAEVIAGFSAIALPALVAVVVIWGLYRYLHAKSARNTILRDPNWWPQ
jgi:hypothetical protein